MLIIVMGLPGSGKSYFSSKLAEEMDAAYLSSDMIRKELFNKRRYSRDEKFAVYDEMLNRTRHLISEEKDVIVDATFYKDEIRRKYSETAGKLGCKTVFIEIWADETTSRKRLGKTREHSEADYNVFLKVKESFEPICSEHLRLRSTDSNIQSMLSSALSYIRQTDDKR